MNKETIYLKKKLNKEVAEFVTTTSTASPLPKLSKKEVFFFGIFTTERKSFLANPTKLDWENTQNRAR